MKDRRTYVCPYRYFWKTYVFVFFNFSFLRTASFFSWPVSWVIFSIHLCKKIISRFKRLYLGNRSRYRAETGPMRLDLKNTISIGGLANGKIVILAVLVQGLSKDDIFWRFLKGVLTLEAHISETVWATDLGFIPLDSAWKILFSQVVK